MKPYRRETPKNIRFGRTSRTSSVASEPELALVSTSGEERVVDEEPIDERVPVIEPSVEISDEYDDEETLPTFVDTRPTTEIVSMSPETIRFRKRAIDLAQRVNNLQVYLLQCQTSGSEIILNSVLRLTSQADILMRDLKEEIEEVETTIRNTTGIKEEAERRIKAFNDEAKAIDKCFKTEKDRAETRYKTEKDKIDKALEEIKSKLFEIKQENNNNNNNQQQNYSNMTLEQLQAELTKLNNRKTTLENKTPPVQGKERKELNRIPGNIAKVKELITKKRTEASGTPATPSGGNRRVTRRRPRY